MTKLRRRAIAVAFMAAGVNLMTLHAHVGAEAAEPSPDREGVYVVSTPAMTLSDSLDLAVSHYGAERVTATLGRLEAAAGRGAVSLNSGGEPINVTPSLLRTEAARITQAGRLAGALAVDIGNPATWPVRGSKQGPNTYWNGMALELVAKYCNDTCTITDRVRISSVTTNPGAVTSKFSYTLIYSPNGGHFRNIFVRTWAICYATTKCGSNTDTTGTGGKVGYVSSSPRMNGQSLAHGYQLKVHFTVYNSDMNDQAKTGKASCHTSDNVCKYV